MWLGKTCRLLCKHPGRTVAEDNTSVMVELFYVACKMVNCDSCVRKLRVSYLVGVIFGLKISYTMYTSTLWLSRISGISVSYGLTDQLSLSFSVSCVLFVTNGIYQVCTLCILMYLTPVYPNTIAISTNYIGIAIKVNSQLINY